MQSSDLLSISILEMFLFSYSISLLTPLTIFNNQTTEVIVIPRKNSLVLCVIGLHCIIK